MLVTGDMAPDFAAPDASGQLHTLEEYRGRTLVLYFYPRDLTSGCSRQACDFRDIVPFLDRTRVGLLGVSADSMATHRRFIAKHGLNFPLLADEDHTIAGRYGVWKEKSMYGRKFMGIERTTFLIDTEGRIERIFAKVKVAGHAQEVLDAIAD